MLENGDEVILTDANGTRYTYEVFKKTVVAPTDFHVTQPVAGRSVVTLQTCTLPDYSDRLIVQAELTSVAWRRGGSRRGGSRTAPTSSSCGAEPGGEVFYGLAALEVALDDLGHVASREAEVPGASGVDDGVRAVFAEAETVHGVHADVPDHTPLAQLFFQDLADSFEPRFLQSPLPHEHVGIVLPDLRGWSRP